MKPSIRNRLLGTTTCVLVSFLMLTGWILDRSFRLSVMASAEEQLRLVIYSIMGVVEESDDTLFVNDARSEPRLTQPESGLYARVSDDLGSIIWLSPSAATSSVAFSSGPPGNGEPGVFVFTEVDGAVPRFVLSYPVIWEGLTNERVTFAAATDQAPFRASIAAFRQNLGVGFFIATLVFVVAQLLALRWGLRPLATMASEVQALEAGQREKLSEHYPVELEGLAHNLDRFIEHEQRSRSRYRHALEDLAHSLKTPLTVVRNALLDAAPDTTLLGEQLDRMESTVTHQLSKASARGPVVVGKPVDVSAQVERLLRALETAYVDKGVSLVTELSQPALVRGDESDFLEIFGNLIENAFKYCQGRVRVNITFPDDVIQCRVDDDGPGIPLSLRDEVLNRGKRLDEIQPGQGIGLAMVADLVELYRGTLCIEENAWGGASILVRLPC